MTRLVVFAQKERKKPHGGQDQDDDGSNPTPVRHDKAPNAEGVAVEVTIANAIISVNSKR